MLFIVRSSRRSRLLAALVATALPSVAFAQVDGGVGGGAIDLRGGDIRSQVEQASDPGSVPATRSGVHITGFLDSDVRLTDNVRQSQSPRVADFGLDLTPSVMVTVNTRLLSGNLSYFPTVELYAKSSDLDRVSQAFNASGNLVVVPNWLFVSARAFGGLTSPTGQTQGSAASGTLNGTLNGYNRNDSGFSRSFEVSPYLRHEFPDVGTVNASYSLSYTASDGFTGIGTSVVASDPASQQLLGIQSRDGLLVSQEAFDFTTGPNLGRVSNDVRALGSQESGGGVSDGSVRYNGSDTVSYALYKFLSISATGGYESISYPRSVPQIRINDFVWGVGVKLIDGYKGTVSVAYGHHDGFDSPSVSASYQFTPRFRAFGSYSEGLGTSLEQFRGQVDGSGVDPSGRSISLVDNAPVTIADQLFGTNTNVFRNRNATLGASLLYSRDVVTLTVTRSAGKAVATSVGAGAFSQSSQYFRLDWEHDLSERLAMNVGLSYGNLSRSGSNALGGNTRTVQGSVGLNYGLSETLSLRAGYLFSSLRGGGAGGVFGGGLNGGFNGRSGSLFGSGGDSVQNLVYVGLRKVFQ